MNNHNVLAIDLAKNVFQVCKVGPLGNVLYNRKLSRQKLIELIWKEKPSLVAMEACASAHYWSRLAKSAGHSVKMMSARAVKPFQHKQKTDRNDALAIAVAATQLHIHSVRVLSEEEQGLQSISRVRELAIAQQVELSNQLRGLLSEFGIIFPQGLSALKRSLPLILEDAENGLPHSFRETLFQAWQRLLVQLEYVDSLNVQLEALVAAHAPCQKLMALEGVGPIGALGLAIRLGKGENFVNGKDAAASIGLTPKQYSSGEKERLGRISKRNADKRLRSILFQGALAVVCKVVHIQPRTQKEAWLKSLIERRGKKIAAIALANKTVRTAYALLKHDSEYKPVCLAL